MGKKVTNNYSEMENKLGELAKELRADFVEWMKNRLKSYDGYGSFLCNLEDAVKDVNNKVLDELEPLLKNAKSKYEIKELKDAKATLNKVAVIDNYLGKLQLFVALGDSLYALTLIDMMQRLLDGMDSKLHYILPLYDLQNLILYVLYVELNINKFSLLQFLLQNNSQILYDD